MTTWLQLSQTWLPVSAQKTLIEFAKIIPPEAWITDRLPTRKGSAHPSPSGRDVVRDTSQTQDGQIRLATSGQHWPSRNLMAAREGAGAADLSTLGEGQDIATSVREARPRGNPARLCNHSPDLCPAGSLMELLTAIEFSTIPARPFFPDRARPVKNTAAPLLIRARMS